MARLKLNPKNFIFNRLQSIAALLISYLIMCLGHGLLNTVLGLRAKTEGYSDIVVGLMTSSYFLGFIFGAKLCEGLITKVGHIRTFAIFATLASAVTLFLAMYVNPISWVVARLVYGAALAALYMVMESWLNLITKNEERGQILSFYMITNYVSIALSQFLINAAEPTNFLLFALASIFLSISLIPVSASRSPQPQHVESEHFPLKKLIETSKLSVVGVFSTGAVLGGFWGIRAFYLSQIGMSNDQVAWFIAAYFIGSLILQWPLGFISDKVGRRKMIVGISACLVAVLFLLYVVEYNGTSSIFYAYLVMSFFFGGLGNTMHSMFIALANDFLKPSQVVKATGGLISVHATGAIIGPLIAAAMMTYIGGQSLMLFFMISVALVLFFAVYQVFNGRKIPKETREDFVPLPRMNTILSKLDPRYKKKE